MKRWYFMPVSCHYAGRFGGCGGALIVHMAHWPQGLGESGLILCLQMQQSAKRIRHKRWWPGDSARFG
jgi:hypothetical protein